MRPPLRIVFMGTPEFAVPTLKLLIEAGHEVVAVYTQPPRPAGRGKREQKSPVHLAAEERGIAVRCPASLKGADEQAEFAALRADVAVVAAYGLILPRTVLDAPGLGCLNVHASLLPRWRGAAPIQRAILAGDDQTGVTIMRMEAGLDTGPMLAIKDGVTYWLGRGPTARMLDRFGGETLTRLKRFVGKNAFYASFMIRNVPSAPFIVVNMAFGATRASFPAFLAGCALGVLPKTALVAFFGGAVVAAVSGDGVWTSLILAGVAVVWLGLMLGVRELVRRRERASGDPD